MVDKVFDHQDDNRATSTYDCLCPCVLGPRLCGDYYNVLIRVCAPGHVSILKQKAKRRHLTADYWSYIVCQVYNSNSTIGHRESDLHVTHFPTTLN